MTPLLQAMRSPLSFVASGFSFWCAHGARVRRARDLCACADGERLRRVRNWEDRSLRLYRRAASELHGLVALDEEPVADWARAAHLALARAQAPYRSMMAGLGVLGAALGAIAITLLLLACAASPSVRARAFPRDLADGRPWQVSSTDPGYPSSGNGPSTDKPALFHTAFVDTPFVEIDLGAEHLIRQVVIENRADCCQERALPLDVEILDGATWRLVAQRRSPFSTWRYDLDPVRAQCVRVLRPGSGYFHLKRISIYGE